MFRKPSLFCWSAVLALTLCLSARGQDSQDHSQDQPSLGDAARLARSQKGNASSSNPKKVITNDDVSSGSGLGTLGLGAAGSSGSSVNQGTSASPSQDLDLDKVESAIAKLDTIDRATLIKLTLQGTDVNFPGRAAWEQRLVAAKQDYVTQLRDLVRQARQVDASAKTMSASHSGQTAVSENDPDVLRLKTQIKELAENAVRISAAFQAVVVEGRNRAGEVTGH